MCGRISEEEGKQICVWKLSKMYSENKAKTIQEEETAKILTQINLCEPKEVKEGYSCMKLILPNLSAFPTEDTNPKL